MTYTRAGLFNLFAWLLWGDFCFTLMEGVIPSVLPLKLNALGASSTLISTVMTTLPGILNATVCPWVSYRSDRHRGPRGRRLPFILSTMPFLTLCLLLLGWSETISAWLHGLLPGLSAWTPAQLSIGLLAVFLVAFQFFNMFANSVFWYLFNDVVPPQFLGRFTGLIRLVGTGAGAFYNFCIFRFADTHLREIFTGAALLYCIGFGLMCLRVREGPHPPPPDAGQRLGLLGNLRQFGRQCFGTRFYWYFYLMQACGAFAAGIWVFGIFFSQEMGLTLADIGKLGGWSSMAGLAAVYFTAIFVDRWHPLRITAYQAVFTAMTAFGGWIWLWVTLPGKVYFWMSLGGMLVGTFGAVLNGACLFPLFMRLLPKSLYGQFSSASSLVRSVAVILSGVLAGLYMDAFKAHCGGSTFAYRWIFLWQWVFALAGAVCAGLGYREWLRLGGDVHYRPPAPWLPEGFEEVADPVASVPATPRAVLTALWLGLGAGLLGQLLLPILIVAMRRYGLLNAAHWYLVAYVPLSLVLLGATMAQLRAIRRDIAAQARGERTRLGIPHHGVLLINAIQGLLGFPIFWVQTLWMIRLGLEFEVLIFGVNSVLTGAACILGTQLLRWLERPNRQHQTNRIAFGHWEASRGALAC